TARDGVKAMTTRFREFPFHVHRPKSEIASHEPRTPAYQRHRPTGSTGLHDPILEVETENHCGRAIRLVDWLATGDLTAEGAGALAPARALRGAARAGRRTRSCVPGRAGGRGG